MDYPDADDPQPPAHPGAGARLVLRALRAYKLAISPFFAGSCRYQPSCSEYMADAIRQYGAGRGILLGLKRLARCHPFGGYGLDPVIPPTHDVQAMSDHPARSTGRANAPGR